MKQKLRSRRPCQNIPSTKSDKNTKDERCRARSQYTGRVPGAIALPTFPMFCIGKPPNNLVGKLLRKRRWRPRSTYSLKVESPPRPRYNNLNVKLYDQETMQSIAPYHRCIHSRGKKNSRKRGSRKTIYSMTPS